jgi:hypothetical protein
VFHQIETFFSSASWRFSIMLSPESILFFFCSSD